MRKVCCRLPFDDAGDPLTLRSRSRAPRAPQRVKFCVIGPASVSSRPGRNTKQPVETIPFCMIRGWTVRAENARQSTTTIFTKARSVNSRARARRAFTKLLTILQKVHRDLPQLFKSGRNHSSSTTLHHHMYPRPYRYEHIITSLHPEYQPQARRCFAFQS